MARTYGRLTASAGAMCAALWPGMATPEGATHLNLFGRPGLIDLPSAEVMDDGDLAFSFSAFPGQNRATLSFQIAPRLTGSFRYSRIADFFAPDDALFDRSFDLSFQLLTETDRMPAVSIGLRDFIGTGFYGSEYIVATKTLSDVTVTGGIGWGRLGTRNPLGAPFGDRPPLDFGEGGTLSTDQWFRGDAALFGGVSWRVTDKLTLTAEYSSDTYAREEARGLFEQKSPINAGLSYRFDHGGVLSAYALHGSELAVGYTYVLNPKRSKAPTGTEAAGLPVQPRPSRAVDPEAWEADWVTDSANIARGTEVLTEALAKEGLELTSLSLAATEARATIRNRRYGNEPQALGRAARVMSRSMPASVEVFRITLTTDSGIPTTTVSMRRSDLERLEFAQSEAMLAQVGFSDAEGGLSDPIPRTSPRLTWALEPGLSLSLFDPENPVKGSVALKLRGRYEIAPGLVAQGAASARLAANFDDDVELGPTGLPRVRSDLARYNSRVSLDSATLAWYAHPAQNIFTRVTGGYLEKMYGGLSAEALWMPVDSRLAFGAEVNWAKKRDYDGALGFADYDTLTGHASAYYEFGDGYLAQVDVGRYLAGDVGATVSLSREFDNGWVVGAFATRTDVSFEDFGEGSFDKGIRLTIPLDWGSGKPTQARNSVELRSLSRDGGARLSVPGRLYESVRETRGPELEDRWGRFWR